MNWANARTHGLFFVLEGLLLRVLPDEEKVARAIGGDPARAHVPRPRLGGRREPEDQSGAMRSWEPVVT